ncbi:MAG TPA: metallophosphoesterase [Kofleriaceae bacterium]|nr:metallophosphoesterase [Kofleriaceae bacterium]
MRLAHCSDLHLLSLDGVRKLQFANKRWIGAMNLLTNRGRHYHTAAFEDMVADLATVGVDHVLCTGDVTNLAFEQEFRFARAIFDRLPHGPDHVTVLPGNHDAYVAEGVGLFAKVFGDHASADADWRWPESGAAGTAAAGDPVPEPDRAAWPLVRVRGPLALIGLTTSRQSPWFTAYGRVGAPQLERLRRVLADPRLRDKARVVAIHHPPAGRRARSVIRGLRDHEAFAKVIAEAGAELVVHGHEHRNLREVLATPRGEIEVLGVPSGTYEANHPERTARYRIIEIEGGRIVGHHLRVWHRARRVFERDDTSLVARAASA